MLGRSAAPRPPQVTTTPNGFDQLRLFRIVTEPFAQPADQHVDTAIEGTAVSPLSQIEQLIAGESAIRVDQQDMQESVLRAAQGDQDAVGRFEMLGARVQLPIGKCELLRRIGQRIETPQQKPIDPEPVVCGQRFRHLLRCAHQSGAKPPASSG